MLSNDLPRRAVLASAGALLGTGCLGAATERLPTERTPPGRADDWRMYGRDPGRTRFVPNATLPRDEPEIAWERSVSASGWRPPIVADGTVYCQYVNGLFVVDRDSGEGPRADTYGGFGRGTGPMAFASTTAYRDGVLAVPYGGTVAGYAADPDGWPDAVDGLGEDRARWWTDGASTRSAPLGGGSSEPAWLGSPLVADGALVSLHPTSNAVSAVEPDDGSRRWRFAFDETVSDEFRVDAVGHVVDTETGTVVVKGSRRPPDSFASSPLFAGVDLATGTLEWTAGDEPEPEERHPTADNDSLVARDGTIYTADWTDEHDEIRLLAIDAATGDRVWRRTLERSEHVGIAVDETAVYHVGLTAESGSDPFAIAAFDGDDGSPRWDVSLDDSPETIWSAYAPPPTVADEHLLLPGRKGLHALERTGGDRLWTFTQMVGTSGGGETERAGLTPAVVSDDRILLGATLVLYALE